MQPNCVQLSNGPQTAKKSSDTRELHHLRSNLKKGSYLFLNIYHRRHFMQEIGCTNDGEATARNHNHPWAEETAEGRDKISHPRENPGGPYPTGTGTRVETQPRQRSQQRWGGKKCRGLSLLPPSSLLPASSIGQTQEEASWWGKLGNIPAGDSSCDRGKSRSRAVMDLRSLS